MGTYEYTYIDNTDPVNPQGSSFTLGGISQDVAKGVRFGLKKVPSISNVTAKEVTQVRNDIPGADPA